MLRVTHRVLMPRCWELRDSLTVYDAAYVALAEVMEVVLVTADAKLAASPDLLCEVELLN
jgi:predicted nucleic acid-binding protein